ncbi:ABC transporter permease [Dethiobacter alkaliphilus]|uniref:ABC transporter permease n=1 Tax=Dethiobacter alkaliphilus TaxID=427926 RepID=UPI002226C101|nr:ABC transporter permease [Dethiobacter alkaliphilus]MCW3491603.1 ABC transporter permease [Dethiobacter alkaliphilus]
MKSKFIKEAARQLWSNKLTTALMAIGIILGISVLTIVIALGQGTKASILERVDRVGATDTFTLRTFPWGQGGEGQHSETENITLTAQDLLSLQQEINGINAIIPTLNSRTTITGELNYLENVSVQGVTSSFQDVRPWNVTSGVLFSDYDITEGTRAAIVGQAIANQLASDGNILGMTIHVDSLQLEVIGVLESRGATGSGRNADEVVLVPEPVFQRLFQPDGYSTVTVQVNDIDRLEAISEQAMSFLEATYLGHEFYVRIPTLTTGTRQETAGRLTSYLTLIAAISLLVGGIIMMNLTNLTVTARTAEIGLRKALGARNHDILTQIMMELFVLAVIAGGIGVLLGVVSTNILAGRIDVNTLFTWHAPAAGIMFSLIVGLLAGVRPANRAAQLDPVVSLRAKG